MATKDVAREIARTIAGECVGVRIRMLNRVVSQIYDDRVRHHGIKVSQLNILTAVTLRGPIPPGQVGRVLALEKSTVSRNVRIMEENGWIESLAGEEGNSYLLQVTRRGEALLKKIRPDWQLAQREVVKLLGSETVSAIGLAVDRIREVGNVG